MLFTFVISLHYKRIQNRQQRQIYDILSWLFQRDNKEKGYLAVYIEAADGAWV